MATPAVRLLSQRGHPRSSLGQPQARSYFKHFLINAKEPIKSCSRLPEVVLSSTRMMERIPMPPGNLGQSEVGSSVSEVYDVTATLLDRDLIQRRGAWRAVLPMPSQID